MPRWATISIKQHSCEGFVRRRTASIRIKDFLWVFTLKLLWKERKAIAAALKPIYHAVTAEIAQPCLDDFDTG